jgi:hypothetical protein
VAPEGSAPAASPSKLHDAALELGGADR